LFQKLLTNIDYYLNAGFGRGFVVCVMICVVPPLLSKNHEQNWPIIPRMEPKLAEKHGRLETKLPGFLNGFNQQKTISDLLFISIYRTCCCIIFRYFTPATSM
jgi:hypothetical protein